MNLCVKKMIIYFFKTSIVCFLISLTFPWTFYQMFTKIHVKILHFRLCSFILQNHVLLKLSFNISIKDLSITFNLVYETSSQFQSFLCNSLLFDDTYDKRDPIIDRLISCHATIKRCLCYIQKLYRDSTNIASLSYLKRF